MIKIKLTQLGKKTNRLFRLVVIEARDKRDGKTIENIGVFDPNTKPPTFKINRQRLEYWRSKGAQLTNTVRKLITQ